MKTFGKTTSVCLFIVAFIFLFATKANAQTTDQNNLAKVEGGIRFMPVFACFNMETSDGKKIKGHSDAGFGGGTFMNYNFTRHLGMQIEMNYNSNAIEGNTLTLRETMLVLQQGITVKGKSLKDHLEVKNQAKAIEYLYDVVDSKKDIPLSLMLIRNLHSLVVQNIDGVEAGSYRTYDVRITGSKHTPPPAFEVPHRMKDLLDWYKENKNKLDIITLATEFKHRFVYIHPIGDGNGLVSRLI